MVLAGAITEQDAHEALTAAGLAAQQTPRDIRAAITGAFNNERAAARPPADRAADPRARKARP